MSDEFIAKMDTLVSILVTPDHQPEDPVKARVDDDNAGVLLALLTQDFDGEPLDTTACSVEAGYVLPAPSSSEKASGRLWS